jgi:tRNA threonylcarbamoyladenosine modification (KEOPS) complex  Pcc1 subunit
MQETLQEQIPEKRQVTTYSEGDKFKVLTTYLVLGSLAETAREFNMPLETLKSWKKQAWWPRMMAQVKGEENAKISARYRNIVLKTQEKLLERIEKGDITVGKDGSEVVLPVRARDLAIITGIATQQLSRMDETKDHEDSLTVAERLTKIAEELVKMTKSKKIPEIIDVTPEIEVEHA